MDSAVEKFIRKEGKGHLLPPWMYTLPQLKKLDELMTTKRNPIIWMINLDKIANTDSLAFLNNVMKGKREVSTENLSLIKNIVSKVRQKDLDLEFLTFVGVLYQISRLVDELERKKFSRNIRMSLLFWAYLNILEVIVSQLGDLFYQIAQKEKVSWFVKEYEKQKKKEGHILMKRLHDFAKCKKVGLCKEGEDNFLSGRDYRNKLAHAGVFYDTKTDKVYLSGQPSMTRKRFLKEVLKSYNFLKELVYALNGSNEDILTGVNVLMKRFQRMLRYIQRNQRLRENFPNIVKNLTID